MSIESFLFGAFPYVAVALAIVVSIYRYRVRPFSYSSLSSQLLERRLLFWGTIPFHWGLMAILGMHLLAFLLPGTLLAWNAEPWRLYALEATGLALGLWALGGLAVLFYRRVAVARIRAVSTGMDHAVLTFLLVSVVTGVATALTCRWGSTWYAAVMAPYLWSLVTFQPRPELLAALPLLVKVHVFNLFVLLAIFPFSRLVHMLALPLGYLGRPWQIVSWNRRPAAHIQPNRLAPTVPPTQPVHVPQKDAVPQLKPRAASEDATHH